VGNDRLQAAKLTYGRSSISEPTGPEGGMTLPYFNFAYCSSSRMLRSSSVFGPPARRVNSIKASSVVKRALRGSAVRMRSVSKKITSQIFRYLKDIRTRCFRG
jgi:hypothetical protein